MTELDRAIAAGLARELRAVYDHVEVHSPAPPRIPGRPTEPEERPRLVVRHRGEAGTNPLAMVVLGPSELIVHLGPLRHRDWSRVETIPYDRADAVERLLERVGSAWI